MGDRSCVLEGDFDQPSSKEIHDLIKEQLNDCPQPEFVKSDRNTYFRTLLVQISTSN